MAGRGRAHANSSDSYDDTHDSVKKMKRINKELDQEKRNLQIYVATLKRDVGELKYEVDQWKKESKTKAVETQKLQAKLYKQNGTISEQDDDIRKMKEGLKRTQTKVVGIKRDAKTNPDLMNELSLFKTKSEDLERKLNDKEEYISELKRQVQRLMEQIDDIKDVKEMLEKQNNKLEEFLRKERDELKDVKERQHLQGHILEELRKERDELKDVKERQHLQGHILEEIRKERDEFKDVKETQQSHGRILDEILKNVTKPNDGDLPVDQTQGAIPKMTDATSIHPSDKKMGSGRQKTESKSPTREDKKPFHASAKPNVGFNYAKSKTLQSTKSKDDPRSLSRASKLPPIKEKR